MDDYGKIVYLDTPKTGSTFISAFLRENLNIDRQKFIKHGRIQDDFRPDTFYFISAREPLKQYLSLYSYGCNGSGAIFNKIKHAGYGGFYDATQEGFERWLEFVLDPQNAGALGKYGEVKPSLYGLMTFRFLVLSFQYPVKTLKNIEKSKQIRGLYKKRRLHNYILRCDHLQNDLVELCYDRLGPFLKDEKEALDFIHYRPAKNRSGTKPDINLDKLSEKTRAKVRQREWFLYEHIDFDGRKKSENLFRRRLAAARPGK